MDSLLKDKLEVQLGEAELETKDFLESFPKRRRYALYLLLILIIPIFFLAKYITAQIYFYKFNQRKISAHPAVIGSYLPVDVLQTEALSIVGKNYSAYALIKNQNNDLALPDLKYVFHFFDSAGREIFDSAGQSQSGQAFLLPLEQKYLILPNVKLETAPQKVSFELINQTWKMRLNVPNVFIETSNLKHNDQQDPPGFFVEGAFRNNSAYTLQSVRISAVALSSSRKIIAVNQYIARAVQSGETRNYRMFWPVALEKDLSDIKISAETNLLDFNNIQ